MTKYDPELRDNTVSEWRLRLLLRLARWEDAYQLTRKTARRTWPPPTAGATGRPAAWSWPSRKTRKPWCCSRTVAKERDFYGFLAADRCQTPYQLNNKPLVLEPGS